MARTKAKLAANERATLALVNTIREATGRKPLQRLRRGFPSDSQHCAIAKPLSGVKALHGVAEHSPGENWSKKHATFTFTDEATARRVAKAIHQPVRAATERLSSDDPDLWDVRLPIYASQFIEDFDEGLYPHLISKAAHPVTAFGA